MCLRLDEAACKLPQSKEFSREILVSGFDSLPSHHPKISLEWLKQRICGRSPQRSRIQSVLNRINRIIAKFSHYLVTRNC